ncbi:hypothetical protein LPW36_04750 [Jinshanibacter sp. LJY008]|uniref:Uncharacterized protein n=1 Tax=Limnobaculum eriocheiris TaxID=2897391 RepID=A0A9X1MW88_9GAMM|nr:hypothetical protein [Limnobaculum eriocheiris]MCD1125340.1 hypothetical protein [Limnobaculum eriocheiris]
MREQTRQYTTSLPRFRLSHLKTIKQMFESGLPALQWDTNAGKILLTTENGNITATIGGRTLSLRTTITQAGYGWREWYLCPHCSSRVADLFVGKKDIACRKCWKLHYASQSENQIDRMRRNIIKQRVAIWGGYPPASNLFERVTYFPKPKGMRWETFERKRNKLIQDEAHYWLAFLPIVDKICGSITR